MPGRAERLDRTTLAGDAAAAAARSSLWDRATPHPAARGPVGPAGSAAQETVIASAPAASPDVSGPAVSTPAEAGPSGGSPAESGPNEDGPAAAGSNPLPRRQPQTHLAAPLRRRPGGSRGQYAQGSTLPSVWDVRRPAQTAGTDGTGGADGSAGDVIANVDFEVDVQNASTTPEPSSAVLLVSSLLFLIAARKWTSRASRRMS